MFMLELFSSSDGWWGSSLGSVGIPHQTDQKAAHSWATFLVSGEETVVESRLDPQHVAGRECTVQVRGTNHPRPEQESR